MAKEVNMTSQYTRPWRTLVRIKRLDDRSCYMVIPAWNPRKLVRRSLKQFPAWLRHKLDKGMRLHCLVNIGAERSKDLSFSGWEREKRRSYVIISTNCDCASDLIARTSTRWFFGPRCPNCNKVLGWMQYNIVGKVRATGDYEAIRLYQEQRKKGK